MGMAGTSQLPVIQLQQPEQTLQYSMLVSGCTAVVATHACTWILFTLLPCQSQQSETDQGHI